MVFKIIITLACILNLASSDVEPIEYLQKFGYLTGNSTSIIDGKSLRDAVITFQEFYKIPVSGEIDDETKKYMQKPRCGNVDNFESFSAYNGEKWNTNKLFWYLHHQNNEYKTIAEKAFALWGKYTDLTFTRLLYSPNISITFGAKKHRYIDTQNNCLKEFDGKGGVLAHSFVPGLETNFLEIHLDEDENWQYTMEMPKDDEISLYIVLVHEIGHALGLRHSLKNLNAVMYPSYFVPKTITKLEDFDLDIDDITGIQYLYGKKNANEISTTTSTTTTSTTTTTTTITHEPPVSTLNFEEHYDLCSLDTTIRIVLIVNGNIYLFYGKFVWIISLSESARQDEMYKSYNIVKYLSFLPKNFSRTKAIYQRPDNSIILFGDNTVYHFNFPSLTLISEKPIGSFLEAYVTNVNAAFRTYTGQSYVIYDYEYLREINECTSRIIFKGFAHRALPGIPYKISGAFRFTNGNIYFFDTNNRVFEYNEFEQTLKSVDYNNVFDMFKITCTKQTILNQLKKLLSRLVD